MVRSSKCSCFIVSGKWFSIKTSAFDNKSAMTSRPLAGNIARASLPAPCVTKAVLIRCGNLVCATSVPDTISPLFWFDLDYTRSQHAEIIGACWTQDVGEVNDKDILKWTDSRHLTELLF